MRKVYKHANRVLVLDADLLVTSIQHVAGNNEMTLGVLARTIASKWQRHAWTLQEGVLTKRLWFHF